MCAWESNRKGRKGKEMRKKEERISNNQIIATEKEKNVCMKKKKNSGLQELMKVYSRDKG